MSPSRQRLLKLSGWTTPLFYTLIAVGIGMLLPRLEHHYLPRSVATLSAPAAEAICSSIASGMIALTGIVFSLTFVMVQFSATAYSPRLVLWVARDPVMSHALGVFISTFLYALILLAWIDRYASGKVPFISGWILFVLLVASMGMFVALIERVGSLQVSHMLIFTGDQGRRAIQELYPAAELASTGAATARVLELPSTQRLSHIGRPQVIQSIHVGALVELAKAAGGVIEVVNAVGDTVVESTPMVQVRGATQAIDEAALRHTIQLGDERTFEQDPKYAIRLTVDIAIKALSPAINDPTTAVQALDQIEDLLLRLGRRCLEIGAYPDPQGELRLLLRFPTWDDFLRLALDEIRFYGAHSVQVTRRMKALIVNLMAVLPAERYAALRYWEHRLEESIARSFADVEEQRHAAVADRQGLGLGRE
jgi:uncharacterized membrane protein